MPTAKELLEAHIHRTGANSFSHNLGACLTLLPRVEKVLALHHPMDADDPIAGMVEMGHQDCDCMSCRPWTS